MQTTAPLPGSDQRQVVRELIFAAVKNTCVIKISASCLPQEHIVLSRESTRASGQYALEAKHDASQTNML